jgi:uroporphyrin-III C-methyltransferase
VTGTVYLVGAGPGAPDLLTLRAARLLERADVVFYDALVRPDTLALARNARLVNVGKRAGRISTSQAFINRCLIQAARRHETVVRLKGGDPMLFGRAQEEIDALVGAGVACEVVPGVTAALAACADLGISLTRRGASRTVAFVTPRTGAGESDSDWVSTAAAAETAVIYMGVGEAERVSKCLIAHGRSGETPVAIVANASLPEARAWYGTLAELPALAPAGLRSPATIVLGEILRARLGATERNATKQLVAEWAKNVSRAAGSEA